MQSRSFLATTLSVVPLAPVVAVFLASSAAWAATISAGVDKYGNHYLTFDGPIVAGDPERLAAAIFQAMLAVTGSTHCVSTLTEELSGKPWPWP